MPKPFYLTTAIDYTNGAPHIGHAYEKILADVLARQHRLQGEEVIFLTGVDQHGQKVQQSAEKAGVSPEKFVADLTAKFPALWEKLEVRYDIWAATTEAKHKQCVQGMLQRLYDEGEIYKDKQEGFYSIRQEQFLTDKERGADGEFGEEWGEVEHRTEENYYFKLARHKDWLLSYLRAHPECVTPAYRQAELVNAVEKLSGDLCISRPKSRLTWGIELPFDKDYVTYVWFDALTNYISFIGYEPTVATYEVQPESFRRLWPALHIIGKDILIPAHGIYWMIMLHALGFPDEQMPSFLVHGWWNSRGTKMSKSLGNVIDPNELADKYGVEALRYYLMSDMVTGKDADFSEDRLITRYNSQLANAVGNLLNRTLSMVGRYRNGELRKTVAPGSAGEALAASVQELLAGQSDELATIALEIGVRADAAIEKAAPWKMAKDETRAAELDGLLYALAESLRLIAILLSPVLPQAARGIFQQLNWQSASGFSMKDAEWGILPDHHLVAKSTPLFPRIEVEAKAD